MRRRVLVGDEAEGIADAVAAPESLLGAPDARYVKSHRRTAVAVVTVGGRELYVKRFNLYAWYRRIEQTVGPTPAARCWRASADLRAAGFAVAPPLAAVEMVRLGIPAESFFVTEAVPGAFPAGRWWAERGRRLPGPERRRFLSIAAAELRRFHDTGFYTRDANADNFLVRESAGRWSFLFLDLENVRRPGIVSRRRRIKNLVQVARAMRDFVSGRDALRFVARYLAPGERLREWLPDLRRVDARKAREYHARGRHS